MKNLLLIALVAISVWSCSNDAKTVNDANAASDVTEQTLQNQTKAKPITDAAAKPNADDATPKVDVNTIPKEERAKKIADAIIKESNRRAEIKEAGGKTDLIESEALSADAAKRKAQAEAKAAAKAKANGGATQAGPKTLGDLPKPKVEKPNRKRPPNHALFTAILSEYVSPTGKVNYNGLMKDRAKLDTYTNTLKNNPPHADWTPGETQAYWVNLYNAFTLMKIINNYPLNSIQDLDGGKPWDREWIKVGGKTYSLNQIENEILRPTYKDPEVHFMVNCAAKSCPPLASKAWTGLNLNSYGNSRAKSFINDKRYNEISANEIKISKIFEWYSEDFGDIITYLNKFSYVKINSNAKVTFKEYDWNLNN